jgi:tetratricopeptide (TPR) repeat protein
LILLTSCASSKPDSDAKRLENDLVQARAAYELDPADEQAIVWLGRRLGYVQRYEEAVEVFTRGLEVHPDSAWLLRFRGHRYITLRRFDDAARDLERARDIAATRPDEVEPDGAPNKAGVPIGTLRSNIDYHLGLAHFLRGDFAAAWHAYEDGFDRARANDDRLVSHTYWAWITSKKLGRDARAARLLEPIRSDMHIVENDDYQVLLRHFRGEITAEELLQVSAAGKNASATRHFGAGMKRLFEGDRNGARELWERAVAKGPKAAFGCIAAEVELARLDG